LSGLNLLMVFLGAGLGGSGRYALGLLLAQPAWLPMPVSTLVVNVVGGFGAGVLFTLLGPVFLKSNPAGLFLMTGLLGGFTTFSAFTAEGVVLWTDKPAWALFHAAAHVFTCLLAFYLAGKLVSSLAQ